MAANQSTFTCHMARHRPFNSRCRGSAGSCLWKIIIDDKSEISVGPICGADSPIAATAHDC